MRADQTAIFMDTLRKGASVCKLAGAANISRQTAYKHLEALAAKGQARIYRWAMDKHGRWSIPVWRYGPGRTAPKPDPKKVRKTDESC